jgi:hypothetical protein
VSLAVANHHVFRHGVKEVLWEDARLMEPMPDLYAHLWPGGRPPWESASPEGCPVWYERECKKQVEDSESRIRRDADRPDILQIRRQLDARLPLDQCWS